MIKLSHLTGISVLTLTALFASVGCANVDSSGEDGEEDLSAADPGDGEENVAEAQEEVIGGEATSDYERVLSIQLDRWSYAWPVLRPTHYCTGTVVGYRAVLTAAHCVCNWRKAGYGESSIHFRQGASVKNGSHMKYNGSVIGIEKVFMPSGICQKTGTDQLGSDLALLQTTQPIGQAIPSGKIAAGHYKPFHNFPFDTTKTFDSVGYGVTALDQNTNSNPQIKKVAHGWIKSSQPEFFSVKPAAPQGPSGGVTCGGDSGGPIFLRDVGQVGVVSEGDCKTYTAGPRLVGTAASDYIHGRLQDLADEE